MLEVLEAFGNVPVPPAEPVAEHAFVPEDYAYLPEYAHLQVPLPVQDQESVPVPAVRYQNKYRSTTILYRYYVPNKYKYGTVSEWILK